MLIIPKRIDPQKWGHSMKKYISLFAFVLTLMACTTEEYKEAVNYKLPSITLDSCVAASDNSFTAYMTVDKGEQFFKHSLQLLVYDIKDVNNALSTINVELGEDRLQKVQKTFNVPVVDDQYIVSAVLKTEKNSFKSTSLFVSLAKMTAEGYLRIWGQPRYQEEVHYEGRAYPYKHATDDIALHFSSERRFSILVKAAMKGKPVEVRVGNHIYPVVWDSLLQQDEDDTTMEVTMTDIEPGIYDVALHWPEAEIPLPKKIRILPLKAEEEETVPFSQFRDQPYDARASFRIGDEMYYFTSMESRILVSCNLNTKAWTKHKDVDYYISEMVAVGSKAYGITDIYKEYGASSESVQNKLYEYNPQTDSWKDLGNLPVTGEIHNMKLFAAGSNVYLCGGQFPDDDYTTPDIRCKETWKYDLASGQWTRVADIPTGENVMQTGNGETNGYVMTPHGFLWVYDSSKDEWEKVSQLTSVYLSNNWGQCLLEHDGKLVYAGHPGSATDIDSGNPCIYSYDFKTRQWELLGLYDVMALGSAILTATFHNGKLILGPILKYLDYPGATCMHFINFDFK